MERKEINVYLAYLNGNKYIIAATEKDISVYFDSYSEIGVCIVDNYIQPICMKKFDEIN